MAAEISESLPFHLRGNYAPVPDEIEAFDLPVRGAIPPALCGLYLRNGPNPKSGTSPHWFLGDGMLHGVRLENGRAAWYRNRWVRTRVFEEDAAWISEDGSVDRSVALANTHVVGHAGRILALVENAFPTEVGPELETLGIFDFAGRLHTAMTAHPKICPVTGELHFFGYDFTPPFLTYHRADAAGRLVQSEPIEVAGPSMMHDFAITESRVLFMDLPIVFTPEELAEGRFPYAWSDSYGARLGVMPRGGRSGQVRWLEIEPCYVFHPMNAFDDGDRVVLDVARYPRLWTGGADRFDPAFLHRYVLEPDTGKVSEQPLDDRAIEFPRVDERRNGRTYRYGYAVGGTSVDSNPSQLLKYDLRSGAAETHDFGAARAAGEGVFVPAGPDAGEDEGYVLAFVYDGTRDTSELVILDAGDFTGPPAAAVELPRRVPFGFHGSWLAGFAGPRAR